MTILKETASGGQIQKETSDPSSAGRNKAATKISARTEQGRARTRDQTFLSRATRAVVDFSIKIPHGPICDRHVALYIKFVHVIAA
ncbi:insulin receptor substrate 1-B-like protein [Corchorus olitorius]|uniref:Insulin receptor substrate 1-B-like protein n=1 Tax=Corchorus olitorius TaxID=93759 RepID=A0A1R3GTH4_9ROSI|nr:insulin receptor substrate 1-B-like protein [Corchorus olitorius]